MATLLLVNPAKETRGRDLKRTLLHILHGLQATQDALDTFSRAYAPHDVLLSDPDPKGILADFDAHVGDTACHTRAQMIWEVYHHYREPECRFWIDDALICLSKVKADTTTLMLALHKKNGYMRALGFGSRVKYGQIFDRIGWSSFVDMFGMRVVNRCGNLQRSESCDSDASSPVPLTPTNPDFKTAWEEFNHLQTLSSPHIQLSSSGAYVPIEAHLSQDSCVFPGWSRATFFAQQTPPLRSHSYRSTTTECSWDINNHLTIIQLLSLCRLLSVGKKASVQAGFPNAAIRARTDPEFIYAQTSKVVQTYCESAEQEVPWSKLITWEDIARKAFLIREEEAAQVWLSTLTTDWNARLAGAMGLSASIQTYIRTSTLISPRQIACLGSHASIIPIRAEWLLRGTPILMVIRRFCSMGYHSTFHRVLPNQTAWQAHPQIDALNIYAALDMGSTSWFDIIPVSMEEVQSAPWVTTPHFILITNSHEGTIGEFYDRIAEDGHGELGNPWPHVDEHCEEYKAHHSNVLASNFASILMTFFSQHDQYPFGLSQEVGGCPDDEGGHGHVAKKMAEARLGDGVLDQYWRSCKGSVESGTGEYPRLYTFEHAYTELPFIVGRQVQEIMEKGIKPVPMGYRWWL